MASDLAIVSGRTGCTSSTPAANAVATGEQPVACAPDTRTSGASSSRPTLCSSSKPLWIFVSSEPLAIGTTTWSGDLPAELLGRLVRERLRALGVERAHVHVHERPRVLGRELRAEPVHVVVVAVDRDDVAAVHRRW